MQMTIIRSQNPETRAVENCKRRSSVYWQKVGVRGQTLKPSWRMHVLWASIKSTQFSGPFSAMHASRTLRVSGHAQQGLHGFFSAAGAAAVVGADWDTDFSICRRAQ